MEMVVIYNFTEVTVYDWDALWQFKSTRSFLPTTSIENGNTSSSVISILHSQTICPLSIHDVRPAQSHPSISNLLHQLAPFLMLAFSN
jgi:hypothetical protein